MYREFQPQLSDREARMVADQRWRQPPHPIDYDGATLAKRLWSLGLISSVRVLLEKPIGGVIKTGVETYERIA